MSDAVETQATEPQATPEAPEKKDGKFFTNDEINGFVARDAKREAARILKEAGLETSGDLKKDVETFKAWKESQMTEAEKLKAELDALKGADAESRKAADAVKAENAALKKGVPADKVDRVVKLSAGYEGDTVEERVTAVLADFPEFARGPVKDIGAPAHGQTQDEADSLLEKARAQLGLKKA